MTTAPGTTRVLHICGRMQHGGAEVRLLELIRHLCPHEFRVDVCALSGVAGALDADVQAHGGEVFPLRLDSRFPHRFLRLLRRGRYRVVHSHVLYTSGLVLALATHARVPVRVAHFHATHDGRQDTAGRVLQRRALRWLIDRYATHIIACGEGSMDAVWRTAWRSDPRCRVVYDAVDPARFAVRIDRERVRSELGVPSAARMFVHVGNQTAEKNHERLLSIFAAISRSAPDAWLVLAGAGTDAADGVTARTVRARGLQERVVALGVRDDVPQILHAADVLLLPSLREGLPGVVLEACVAGVPTLAADLPGVREIASRLLLVRRLPLSAADEEWARVALALPAEAARIDLRATAPDLLRSSVFHIDRAVDAHRGLWHPVSSREAAACS